MPLYSDVVYFAVQKFLFSCNLHLFLGLLPVLLVSNLRNNCQDSAKNLSQLCFVSGILVSDLAFKSLIHWLILCEILDQGSIFQAFVWGYLPSELSVG